MAAHWAGFVGIAALVVITPGMSTAVVLRNTAARGRAGGLLTATGIALGNSTWAVASAAGLAALLRQSPDALSMIRWGGAVCLAWLGARSLQQAWRLSRAAGGQPGATAAGARTPGAPSDGLMVGQGLVTNLLNPAVPLLYVGSIPLFVEPGPGFAAGFLALAFLHVAMAFVCHLGYSSAFDWLAGLLAAGRRTWILHAITGAALLLLAVQALC
ncbi:MAG: LysE family translocator [Acidobacteriota bacterium]